jgi:hypothetical protein
LNVNEFIEGMLSIFSSEYDDLVEFIFKLYDYSKSGKITKSDIRLIFSYIPLNNKKFGDVGFKYESHDDDYQKNTFMELEETLNKLFMNNLYVNLSTFKTKIDESCETFLFVI